MTDYKSMYYHLAGRTAMAVDVLETTTSIMEATVKSLTELKEKLKLAQQTTEEIFLSGDDDDSDDNA